MKWELSQIHFMTAGLVRISVSYTHLRAHETRGDSKEDVLREIGDFDEEYGYYPTTEETVSLTDEARKEIACEKKQGKEIADQAVREKKQDGKVTVLCPKCKNAPKVILNGNRTIVKCSCGYILDAEIYL